jgi:mRNA interferase YafQ
MKFGRKLQLPCHCPYRECHVKPDLLLIYRKSDADTLRLARLGSHSELFG